VQYFTGIAGVIHSYGHNQADQAQSTLLQNQDYDNCIRRERGERGILYTDKKKFTYNKEIQNGALVKSHMTNGLLIYGEIFAHFLTLGSSSSNIRKLFLLYDVATAPL
jgi:hypothetical protein